VVPSPIQKLMSVPIMDRDSVVVGCDSDLAQGLEPRTAQDFSREDLHDLELAGWPAGYGSRTAHELVIVPSCLYCSCTPRLNFPFRATRRSVPVISFGSSSPSIPSTVGEMVAQRSAGLSVN